MAIYPTKGRVSWAIGTATAETAQQAIIVPDNAIELVKTRGHIHSTQGAADESACCVFKLTGDNWHNNPYEFFSEIICAKDSVIDSHGYAMEPRWWNCGLPVSPGSTIQVTTENLDALATNGRASIDCLWSTRPTGMLPHKRKCTRETADTTSVSGSDITLTDAARILDFSAGLMPSAVAADDPSMASIQLTCSALAEQQTFSMNVNVHTIEATTGEALTALMKAEVDIGVASNPCTFTSLITLDVALATAGAWFYSIGYLPTSINP